MEWRAALDSWHSCGWDVPIPETNITVLSQKLIFTKGA
jgi:hypothetical protein